MHRAISLITSPEARERLARVRILYTDIDGTLVSSTGSVLTSADGTPSTALATAIVRVAEAGLAVVPVSGRTLLQLREVTQLLGWHGYIAEAGGIIVHGLGMSADVRIETGDWTSATIPAGVTPFEAINEVGAVEALMEAFPGRIEPYTSWKVDRYVTLLLRGCLDHDEAQEVLDRLPLPIDLVDNGLVRNPGTLTCEDRRPHAYHVVPRGVSKARAIEDDLAWRGLTRDQAAAIGDSVADLGMADAVGTMVLVANAFDSAGVTSALETTPRENVWRTAAERCEGWAEFAESWVGARE